MSYASFTGPGFGSFGVPISRQPALRMAVQRTTFTPVTQFT
jgi:hypothetical protein